MESRDRPTLSLRAGDLQGWTVKKLRWHLEEVAENNLSTWQQLFREHYLGAGFDGLPGFLRKDRDFLFTEDAPLKCASLFKRIACGTLMVDGVAEQGRLFDDAEDIPLDLCLQVPVDRHRRSDPVYIGDVRLGVHVGHLAQHR